MRRITKLTALALLLCMVLLLSGCDWWDMVVPYLTERMEAAQSQNQPQTVPWGGDTAAGETETPLFPTDPEPVDPEPAPAQSPEPASDGTSTYEGDAGGSSNETGWTDPEPEPEPDPEAWSPTV